MHKLGIIGFGGMAGWHLKNCIKSGSIQPVAAYDIDPKRLIAADKEGLKTYKTPDEFFESHDFDVVLVATPNNFHHDYVCRALREGYHVVCEKPVAMSSDELLDMIKTSEETGYKFTVHQNRRWDTDFLTVSKAVEDGKLGDVYAIESCVHGQNGVPHGWREFKVAGGGMMLDWGVHLIDQLMFMIKEKVTDVYCQMESIRSSEVDDYFKLLFKFESGKTAQVEVGTFCLITKPRWYITGSEGSMVINDWDCNGRIVHANTDCLNWEPEIIQTAAGPTRTMAPRPKDTLTELPIEKVIGEWSQFYVNFCKTIDGEAEPYIKLNEVMRVFKVMETAFESAKLGHSVSVDI